MKKSDVDRNTMIALSITLAISLYVMETQKSKTTTELAANQENSSFGRWRFLDVADGAEGAAKKRLLHAIDKFWADFKANGTFLSWQNTKNHSNEVGSWFQDHLSTIDSRFEWEMGSGPKQQTTSLDICRGNAVDRMPLLQTMVERAGSIPGWDFGCYRDAQPPENIESAFEARTRQKLKPFHAELVRKKDNSITVTILSPNFSQTPDTQDDLSATFILCELLEGEENLDKWIGEIHSKTSKGTSVHVDPDIKKDATEFTAAFTKIKNDVLASLSDKYYYQIPRTENVVLFRPSEEAMKAMEKVERTRITNISQFADLTMGLNSADHFSSERFSKLGEKFAYLELIDDGTDSFDQQRDKFEVTLDDALRAEKLGSLVGSGRGKPETYYFDLALTDVDKAIEVIKTICQSQKVPRRCWLRFYDDYWKAEWVKIFPETPALDHPLEKW